MEFVTVKESHSEADLLVWKSRLEAEGIKCYMKNEFTTQIMSHMATFMTELQVSINDLEKAQEVMNDVEE